MKDGLSIDDSTHYTMTQTVTDRASSTYSNVLTVSEGAPGGVAGTYTCTVSNELGNNTREVVAVGEFSGAVHVYLDVQFYFGTRYRKHIINDFVGVSCGMLKRNVRGCRDDKRGKWHCLEQSSLYLFVCHTCSSHF